MSTENKVDPLVWPKQLLRDAEEYMRGYLLLQRDSKLPAKTPMSAFAVAGYGAIVSRTYEADLRERLNGHCYAPRLVAYSCSWPQCIVFQLT